MAELSLVGIYGGTFDPIHFGHLRVAEELVDNIAFDRFYFVPSGEPRLRDTPAASKNHRVKMVKLAIEDNPAFILDEREIIREGVSTTIESLREYHAEFDDHTAICIILGADAFLKLHHWHCWKEIFHLCHLVIVDRPGSTLVKRQLDLPKAIQQECASRWTACSGNLASQSSGMIHVAQTTLLDISATHIRTMVAEGKSIRYLLPQPVYDFIKTNHLYTGANGFRTAGQNYS